jgi:hypothetical protein
LFKQQLKYPLRLSQDLGLVAYSSGIFSSEGNGLDVQQISHPSVPGAGETKSALLATVERLKADLLSRYRAEMLPEEARRLSQSTPDVQGICDLVSLVCVRRTGGQFRLAVEQLMQAKPGTTAVSQSRTGAAIKKAMLSKDVPQTDRKHFLDEASAILSRAAPSDWFAVFESDSLPVWSPSGDKFAFVRSDLRLNMQKLYLLDTKTHREREIFSAHEIRSVSWSRDGHLLVLQSTRLLGMRSVDDNAGGASKSGPHKVTTPGYPEIWLLQIKRNGDH